LVEISVIIPTYNEEKGIEVTLKSLSMQTFPRSEYEIIVVDGNSTDRTREIAARLADKVVLQKGKGVGGARNDGVAVAGGRIVVHTDGDAIVSEGWLENIRSIFKGDVVCVCGPDSPREAEGRYRAFYGVVNSFVYLVSLMGFVWTRGTNTSVRRDAFVAVGGYSDLPILDDGELGLRLKKVGRIVYSPGVGVKVSMRRFKKHGISSIFSLWLKNDLMMLVARRRPRAERGYHKEAY
jgi:glycosyltransferase involved in cell wall biosynthesis